MGPALQMTPPVVLADEMRRRSVVVLINQAKVRHPDVLSRYLTPYALPGPTCGNVNSLSTLRGSPLNPIPWLDGWIIWRLK